MRHILFPALAISCALMGGCSAPHDDTLHILAGTYGEAIHAYDFSSTDCSFTQTAVIPAYNPSYIAFGDRDSQGRRTLYAVREDGVNSGISSFAENAEGVWEKSGDCDIIGADPCFVYPLTGTPYVLTADYSGGVLSVFRTEDGAVSTRCQSFDYASVYQDGAPVADRQAGAHIHQVKPIPSGILSEAGIRGEWVLASDLGNDQIHILSLVGSSDQPLTERGQISCGPGAGPRHMEFDPATLTLYCITELSGEVIAWRISSDGQGAPVFTEIQRTAADEVHAGGSADIHLSPDGHFLYTSHRLQNDGISVFSVNPDGTVTKTGYTLTGPHPRNFAITPDGTAMLVACRDGRSIEVYTIDKSTGLLTRRAGGLEMEKDAPVCVLIP